MPLFKCPFNYFYCFLFLELLLALFIIVFVELVVVSVIHIGLISDTGHMLYTRTLYGLKLYLNATSGAICLLS
jgi:hypothetical protein